MRRAVLALALAACSQSGPTTMKGTDFTVTIPDGWRDHAQVDGKDVADGSYAIGAADDPGPGRFRGTILINPVALQPGAFDVANHDACQRAGEAAVKGTARKLTGVEIVDGPAGKTCQIDADVPDSSPPSQSRATFISGAKSVWMVVCNHEPQDAAALDACSKVLASWRFDA